MITDDSTFTVDYNCERLVKRTSNSDPQRQYYVGTILTKHGLVSVESHFHPYFTTNKGLYTFLSFALNGQYFTRTIKQYKPYTPTGLARIAGRFAKEKFQENQT